MKTLVVNDWAAAELRAAVDKTRPGKTVKVNRDALNALLLDNVALLNASTGIVKIEELFERPGTAKPGMKKVERIRG